MTTPTMSCSHCGDSYPLGDGHTCTQMQEARRNQNQQWEERQRREFEERKKAEEEERIRREQRSAIATFRATAYAKKLEGEGRLREITSEERLCGFLSHLKSAFGKLGASFTVYYGYDALDLANTGKLGEMISCAVEGTLRGRYGFDLVTMHEVKTSTTGGTSASIMIQPHPTTLQAIKDGGFVIVLADLFPDDGSLGSVRIIRVDMNKNAPFKEGFLKFAEIRLKEGGGSTAKTGHLNFNKKTESLRFHPDRVNEMIDIPILFSVLLELQENADGTWTAAKI